jgi:hypothetical protein
MEWRKAGFAELDLFITTIVTDTDGGQKTESVEVGAGNGGKLGFHSLLNDHLVAKKRPILCCFSPFRLLPAEG